MSHHSSFRNAAAGAFLKNFSIPASYSEGIFQFLGQLVAKNQAEFGK